jgi:hypothetical protein
LVPLMVPSAHTPTVRPRRLSAIRAYERTHGIGLAAPTVRHMQKELPALTRSGPEVEPRPRGAYAPSGTGSGLLLWRA